MTVYRKFVWNKMWKEHPSVFFPLDMLEEFYETKNCILPSDISPSINKPITPVKNKKKLKAFEIYPMHLQSNI